MSWTDVPTHIYGRAAAVFIVLVFVGLAMGMFRIDEVKNKESCCDLISEKRRVIKLAIVFPVVGCILVLVYVAYITFVTKENPQELQGSDR